MDHPFIIGLWTESKPNVSFVVLYRILYQTSSDKIRDVHPVSV